MNILGLIPARGGSKGIPRKNIREIGGRPLIAWTIDAARESRRLSDVVVSTDDEEIAAVARQCGAHVPFVRPPELATDEAATMDVVFHALGLIPRVDAVLLLQATSPLRTCDDVSACLDLAASTNAPAVVSVTEAKQHPNWMFGLDSGRRLRPIVVAPPVSRRQDLAPVYALNGSMYYGRTEWLRSHGTFVTDETVAYVMPEERSVDLDTMVDWRIAETLMRDLR